MSLVELKLPPVITNTLLWSDFAEAINTELNLLKDEIDVKKYYLDALEYTDKIRIVGEANSFGYDPNLSIRNDLEFMQRELESIYFKIIHKGILSYYKYIFNIIPYPGRIYLMYYDEVKLIKHTNYETSVVNLNAYSFNGSIFNGFEAYQTFDTVINNLFALDQLPLMTLDETPEWTLDTNINVTPTNHVIAEFVLKETVSIDGQDFLMPASYFKFLEKALDYGRKASNIPHAGCQLNLPMSESLYFDLYDAVNIGYSFPDIKTCCSVTRDYKDRIFSNPFIFDDSPDQPFDQALAWHFDTLETASPPKTIDKLFKKVILGNSTKSLFSKNYPNIWTNLIFHASFDEESGTDVDDVSLNNYTVTILNSYTRTQGISGKAVNFNGTDTEIKVTSFTVADDDMTFCIWLKDWLTQSNDPATIFYHESAGHKFHLYLDYDAILLKYKIYMDLTGVSTSDTFELATLDSIDEVFLTVLLDTSANEIQLGFTSSTGFIYGLAIDTSAIGAISGTDDMYIGSKNGSEFFTGILDEFRIYNRLLTSSEIAYLHDEKLGSLKNIANRVYTMDIDSENNRYEEDGWKILQIMYPANAVNNEVVGVGDGSTISFNIQSIYFPIENKTPVIKYIDINDVAHEVRFDKLGLPTDDYHQGTFNYETGAITLSMEEKISILNEELYAGTAITFLNGSTANTDILPSSITLGLLEDVSGANWVYSTDDGLGNLSGGWLDASGTNTINYSTGVFSLDFSIDIKAVSIFYTYLSPMDAVKNNENITIDYVVEEDDFQITEAGIFDDDDKLVVYSKFPPIDFYSKNNHLAINFAVKDI